MSTIDTKFYEKKKSTGFYISSSLLLLVALGTIFLYFYTLKIETNNQELSGTISNLTQSIEAIEENKLVQVYSSYINNKPLFDKLSAQSQIPLYVSHLKKNFTKYTIDGVGFVYTDGNITVELEAQTNDAWYAFEKTVKFLTEYAADEKSLFDIQEIESFDGYDTMKYTGEFKIK